MHRSTNWQNPSPDAPDRRATPRQIVLRWAQATRDVIALHRSYVRLTGDIGAGAALSQLLYWFDEDASGRCRARVRRHGHRWVAKTAAEFAAELGLLDPTTGQPRAKVARRYLHMLEAQGLIERRVMRFGGLAMLHLRPRFDAIAEALDADLPIGKPEPASRAAPDSPTEQSAAKPGDPPTPDSPNGQPAMPEPVSGFARPGQSSMETETTADPTTSKAASRPAEPAAADSDPSPPDPSPPDPRPQDAPTSEPDAPTEHWAEGSDSFNALCDVMLLWLGKDQATLHPATRRAIRSGAGKLLRQGVTADEARQHGKRWFDEHWIGADARRPVSARRPSSMRQIQDWISGCRAQGAAGPADPMAEGGAAERPPRPDGAPEAWFELVHHEFRPGDWRRRSPQLVLGDLGLDPLTDPSDWPAWLREAYDREPARV